MFTSSNGTTPRANPQKMVCRRAKGVNLALEANKPTRGLRQSRLFQYAFYQPSGRTRIFRRASACLGRVWNPIQRAVGLRRQVARQPGDSSTSTAITSVKPCFSSSTNTHQASASALGFNRLNSFIDERL